MLDPPQPEGGSLERTLNLAAVPARARVAGPRRHRGRERNRQPRILRPGPRGEFRTYALINGQRIDYLNRYVKTSNKTAERIVVPIPDGLLHPGKNAIRLELTPDFERHKQLDDLGILQIALEFGTTATRPAAAAEPGPP